MATKTAPGIIKIEYKILGSLSIHDLPFVKDYADSDASLQEKPEGRMSNVDLTFRITEKPQHKQVITTFLQSVNQHLLFKVYFASGLVRILGSAEFRPVMEVNQVTGTSAGDYVGYLIDVNWKHPYVF